MTINIYPKSFFLASIFYLVSCSNSNAVKENEKDKSDTNKIVANDTILKQNQPQNADTTSPTELDLAKAGSIEILSLNKEINEANKACNSWNLTADEIKIVIPKFKQMSSESQYLGYLDMPCRISGTLKIDSIEYKYWLNAGSTLILKYKETSLYFGCPKNECKKYFISGEQKPQ